MLNAKLSISLISVKLKNDFNVIMIIRMCKVELQAKNGIIY